MSDERQFIFVAVVMLINAPGFYVFAALSMILDNTSLMWLATVNFGAVTLAMWWAARLVAKIKDADRE